MPRTINPIKKAKVKKALMEDKSIAMALKEAGYSKGSIRGHNNATSNVVVRRCMEEIQEDIKTQCSVEYVLDRLYKLAEKAKNNSDKLRALELIGKWQAMFTNKEIIDDNRDHKDSVNRNLKILGIDNN